MIKTIPKVLLIASTAAAVMALATSAHVVDQGAVVSERILYIYEAEVN